MPKRSTCASIKFADINRRALRIQIETVLIQGEGHDAQTNGFCSVSFSAGRTVRPSDCRLSLDVGLQWWSMCSSTTLQFATRHRSAEAAEHSTYTRTVNTPDPDSRYPAHRHEILRAAVHLRRRLLPVAKHLPVEGRHGSEINHQPYSDTWLLLHLSPQSLV